MQTASSPFPDREVEKMRKDWGTFPSLFGVLARLLNQSERHYLHSTTREVVGQYNEPF